MSLISEAWGSWRAPDTCSRRDMTWAGSRLSAQRLSVCPTCQIHFLRSDLELQYGTVTGEERAPRFSQVIWSLPPSLALQQAALRRRAVIKSLISIELDCSRHHLALSRLHDKQKHKSPLRTTLLSVCDIYIMDRHKQ